MVMVAGCGQGCPRLILDVPCLGIALGRCGSRGSGSGRGRCL